MTSLLDKDFIVVAGKGGTGRTTASLVIGNYLAKKKMKTLICLANALPRYQKMLGQITIGPTIQNIAPFLDIVNLEPRASREEYGRVVLRNRTLHKLVFSSKIVRSFLDAVPGLAEWAMLGKATHHALNEEGGSKQYDTVIFDSPATGHGLDILALPRAIVSAVPTGRMREEALLRCNLMEDPARCEVIPVTLPEELPVNETVEFTKALSRIKMNVERVIINRISKEHLSTELEKLVDESFESGDPEKCLLPSAVVLSRQRAQSRNIKRLRTSIDAPQITLPDIPLEGLWEKSLPMLVDALTIALEKNTEKTL